MIVKVKRLHPDAKIPFKKYDSDFCYDLVAVTEEEIAPNVWRYGTGLAFQIDVPEILSPETVLSIDVRPRSSVWKTGMVLANCEGTVDVDYRGEVMAVFYHVLPDMPRYKVGDKICQMKIGWTDQVEFALVDELDSTDRNSNGFGSTGR